MRSSSLATTLPNQTKTKELPKGGSFLYLSIKKAPFCRGLLFFLYRLFRDVSGELLDAVNDLSIDLKGAWDIVRDLEAFARDDLYVLWILLDVGALKEGWEEKKGSKLSFAEDGGKGKDA